MVGPRTYAVSWREDGTRFVGSAELRRHELRLEGRSNGEALLRVVPYAEIRELVVSRHDGGRELSIEVPGPRSVRVASLDHPGSLTELADELHRLADASQCAPARWSSRR